MLIMYHLELGKNLKLKLLKLVTIYFIGGKNDQTRKEQLLRLENKIDNLSNQVSGLYAKLEKLDRHIDFIDKTYDGLKGSRLV